MATILPFTPRAAATSLPPFPVEASVIIFPGVRYERPGSSDARAKADAASVPVLPTPRH